MSAAGSRSMIRRPAVAGMFYPADEAACAEAAAELVGRGVNESAAARRRWRGAIVPHAGWICSGAIAGEAIGTMRASRAFRDRGEPVERGKSVDRGKSVEGEPDVVVVFGAVHTPLPLERAVFGSHRRWHVPGGETDVAGEVADRLSAQADFFALDDRFHVHEHAVEVELPLVQRAWPGARLLPVEVPPIDDAVAIGREVAAAMRRAGLDAVYLASSDLTHYGPAYGFAPAGVGLEGLDWARQNDARLLDLVSDVVATDEPLERVLTEVRSRHNACGGGAIAAMLAACRERGDASEAVILRHASSYETLEGVVPESQRTPDNAVGYAAVVVG